MRNEGRRLTKKPKHESMGEQFRTMSESRDKHWENKNEPPMLYDEHMAENHCKGYIGAHNIMADTRDGARHFMTSYETLGPEGMLCLEEFRDCMQAEPHISLNQRYREAKEYLKRQLSGPPVKYEPSTLAHRLRDFNTSQHSVNVSEKSYTTGDDLSLTTRKSSAKGKVVDRSSLEKPLPSKRPPPKLLPRKPLPSTAQGSLLSPPWPLSDEAESSLKRGRLNQRRARRESLDDNKIVPNRSPLEKLTDKTKALGKERKPSNPIPNRFEGSEEESSVSSLDEEEMREVKMRWR